jgi:penicillin-binding protein 1A
VVFLALLGLAAVAGAGLGYFMRFDLPDVRALEDYRPPLMTRVMDRDGALLDTFAEQRRILIDLDDIPLAFRDALLASEDSSFFRHTGIDVKGILRAAWRDLRSLRLAQGASTLTQQLARNLFLHPEKTFRRKLQEALLALEIERQYTKEEILRFYCNQVYMGHGRYGLEAASRYYFNIPARELSLGQAATLAGLLQRPEALSPKRHPERALERRNYVLRRMVEVGFLTPEESDAARSTPLETTRRDGRDDLAPYFVEEVRRWLQERYGSSSLYTGGLTVRTTVDPALQDIANRAVDLGLRQLDKRQGWRGVARRVPDGEDLATWASPEWTGDLELEIGRVHDGVVIEVSPERARVRVGIHTGTLGAEAIAWTGKEDPDALVDVGDIVRVHLSGLADDGSAELTLDQEPLVEGAMVVLDPSSGAVRALVGGHDFERSEYNRAIQASRQTGSAFKPFVYAAALASGWTLADILLDEPTVFLDPRNPEPYQPENYTNEYYGTITLRTGLEKSANIATVKLLDQIGYEPVISMARKLGITTPLRPFPSLALGSFETRLLELTAAYGVFANQGVLVEPHLVEEVIDQDAVTTERFEPEVTDAVSPQCAYLLNRLLAGVITDGTGRAAASLGLNLAGKTGTTDDNTDAWFIGYGPDLAVGVWVGFDEPRSLGRKETGALAALPIWRAFMQEAFAGAATRQFPMPPGISIVSIDRRTGLRANPRAYCHPVISEAFVAGTEPTKSCSVYEHQRLRMPYSFQRFPLGEEGELLVPSRELDRLLASEPHARLVDRGRRLEVVRPEESVSIPIRIIDDGGERPPDARLDPFETATWVGKDGRFARVVWIDGRTRIRAGL